ncbi:MAG: hypothetical protein KBS42_04055 [Bacteroidales bacterium]|nr:hypothetical protein [Candidatus Colicola coprequi]
MFYTLISGLHKEDIESVSPSMEDVGTDCQTVAVMTGGTEAQFVQLLQQGRITLDKPIYLLSSGQSNSLAASMEILSYINQHGGHGQIRINR